MGLVPFRGPSVVGRWPVRPLGVQRGPRDEEDGGSCIGGCCFVGERGGVLGGAGGGDDQRRGACERERGREIVPLIITAAVDGIWEGVRNKRVGSGCAFSGGRRDVFDGKDRGHIVTVEEDVLRGFVSEFPCARDNRVQGPFA